MATEKDLLMGVLTKTLNMTEEEVADLLYQKTDGSDEVTLKEDTLPLVLDRDSKRIENVKKAVKPDQKLLEGQYSRGKKEALEELETTIKEMAGIESDAHGADLVKEALDHASECSVEITDDKVKSHPLYLDLLKKSVSKTDYETLKSEYETYQSNHAKLARLERVKSDVTVIWKGMNPVESENAKVAENRRNDFFSKFNEYDYEIVEDGNHIIKKDGEALQDAHGNPVKFEDFVRGKATEYYDFSQQSSRGNAGNQGGNGRGTHIDIPKTEAEYLSLCNDLMLKGDKEGLAKLQAAWREKNLK